MSPRSATAVLTACAEHVGEPSVRLTPFPTGYEPLDAALGGGLHAEDLVLVGGRPGIGKTVALLQWARSAAMRGSTAVYACYEHGEEALLTRLLCLELGDLARPEDVPVLDELRLHLREFALGALPLDELLASSRLVADAYAMFRSYSDRLHLLRATAETDVEALSAIARDHADGGAVVVVDYLQKVPASPALDEAERVTRVASGLKELALSRGVTMVAAVAADRDGLLARRLRVQHLRGSTALAHEADVVVILNEKWTSVSKAHLAYDATRARTYRQWVVFSIEKNRDGPAMVDLEFKKDFPNYRFEPQGRFVAEQLVDDVLFEQ